MKLKKNTHTLMHMQENMIQNQEGQQIRKMDPEAIHIIKL